MANCGNSERSDFISLVETGSRLCHWPGHAMEEGTIATVESGAMSRSHDADSRGPPHHKGAAE